MTQVCPNGPRTSGVPVTPGELAEAVVGAFEDGTPVPDNAALVRAARTISG